MMHTRSAGHELDALTRGDNDFPQCFFACNHMRQIVLRLTAQRDLRIGQTEVGIEQHDLLAHHRQRHRQIRGEGGFTHATLAAGDADDFSFSFS